tara:strand:- start:220 stop:444 length:225 start_codon:yes stop_codon:yes gene_type:complete
MILGQNQMVKVLVEVIMPLGQWVNRYWATMGRCWPNQKQTKTNVSACGLLERRVHFAESFPLLLEAFLVAVFAL